MYRILILEDDPGIAQAIAAHLESWGFEAKCAENFRDIMPLFAGYAPHLVLLDIRLPYYSGYYWCEAIRRVSRVPVIFISSASENMNIVTAMDLGADDFIAKPFDLSVLMAKIRALLRRAYDFGASPELIAVGDAMLDTGDASLISKGGRTALSKNEYRILCTLLRNRGRVVSREKLMQALWETDCFVDENTLSVNINRLRKKLDAAGLPGIIVTRVGAGYEIEP